MMQTYNDIPIRGTKQKRQLLKFRDVEKIDKQNSKKNKHISVDKKRWLNYNTPRDDSSF